MKKFYRVIILFIVFIVISTINPRDQETKSNKKNIFFSINEIEIENNDLIDKEKILEKLKRIYGKNILFLKKYEIEEPLKLINFLDNVEVKKIYPNKIIIKISESKPIGIIIKKNKKYILDTSSRLILYNEKILSNSLPLIVGDNAEKEFVNLFNLLEKHDFPTEKIKNYYYFQIGLWDSKLFIEQLLIMFVLERIYNLIIFWKKTFIDKND